MIDKIKHVVWGIGLLFTLTITSVSAQSDFFVGKVVLSKEVENRNPKGIFTPPAYCEKDKNGQGAIPVIQSSQTSQVVFWTKIETSVTGNLRHSWHHKSDGAWTKISEVNISVRPSSGYRIWSIKSLHPDIHAGEWMIVVAPSDEPHRILCITRFSVN